MNINAVETCMNIAKFMAANEIWSVTLDDEYIGILSNTCGH